MASNCEDISAQMMELLYGELPADARASVDAHVAGCDRCRSELEGFEKTRALARRGLDEAPPARARAAIMQAAAAHLAAQAQPAAPRAAAPDKVSLWDRLRARWAFPTLATIGAVAVFVVANRVFLNPERTMSRPTAVESHEEAPVAPVKPMTAPASSGLDREAAAATRRFEEQAQAVAKARATPRPTAASGVGDTKPAARDDLDRLHKDVTTRGAAQGSNKKGGGEPRGAFAEPPLPKAETLADKTRRDQPMDGRFAPPPPPREGGTTVKRKAPVAESVEKEADEARAPAASSAGPGGLVGGAGAPRGKADGFGAGAAPAAAAPAPAPARNEAAKRAISAPATAPVAEAAPAMAPAPPAPASVAKPRAKKSAEPAPEEAYAAEGDAKKEEKQSSANLRGNANDTLLQRADRLFADGRWTEAAAIYRELLRRDPHNDDAERWRRRLVAAETAEVNERNANLAEKRNAETARTQKRAAPAKASKPSGKAAASDAAQ